MAKSVSTTAPALCVLGALLLAGTANAQQFSGAIFTTDQSGTTVNGNIYTNSTDVYLNGGPQNVKSAGLPDGTYYFQVTDPSGGTVLSTDPALCRQLVVVAGVVAGAAGTCPHPNGTYNPANQSTTVQLAPFSQTPNPGGEYKAYLISQANGAGPDPSDPSGISLLFNPSDAKTDNFKIQNGITTPLYITGYKWYDTNANGVYDAGEPYIPGWHIDGLDQNTNLTFFTYTNSNGYYSFLADPNNTYTISEAFPNATWLPTTATSAIVPVLTSNVAGPNFGNVCVGSGGGLTIGYWGNKNGQAEWVPIPYNAPYLVNASGAFQNFSSSTAYSSFKTWLGSATATNMAYMLSAQLAGMYENVNGGTSGPNGTRTPVNSSALVNVAALPATYSVPAGCSLPAMTPTAGGFATVGNVMTAASCAISKAPVSISGGTGAAYRSYEEWLKNTLDAANNNTSFIQVPPAGGGLPASCSSFGAYTY